MNRILGLDLGTNSIGWALIDNREKRILGMGSRIIPMDAAIMGDFEKGNSISQTADRTKYRSTRRLRERHLLRRERLHRIFNVLKFLPEHYANEIDFEKQPGKFLKETEPKLAWKKNQQNKFNFLFQKSFEEMLTDFKQNQPTLLNRKNKKGKEARIPYDWTIYYLRKKALEKAISKEELAWLILNFNQKRGYYQLRGEDDETPDKKEYVEVLKIVGIEKGEVDKKNNKRTWYTLMLSNGWSYSATFTTPPQWLNTEKEFLITEELDANGNVKIVKDKKTDPTGKEKRKITPLPSFEEIDLMSKADQDKIYKKIKAKTELTISNSGKTVGSYIYDTLLQKPNQKIRGKLVRTVERKFYKDELKQILKKQIELQPELFTGDLYNDCIRELYRNNEAHQLTLNKRDFVHLFLDDIIFYQRPLRSQKSSISNCSLELRKYKLEGKDGNEIEVRGFLKVIPKSNPYYQEFRLWQWIKNLIIYKKEDDSNVTSHFLNSIEDYEKLFEYLMTQKEVNHKDILEYFITPVLKSKYPNAKPKALKSEISKEIRKYRWNYVFDDSKDDEDDKSKKYPCNETGYEFRRRLEKAGIFTDILKSFETEYQLWHIIYSVTDRKQYETAIGNFIKRYNIKHQANIDENSFKNAFIKFPPFKSEYGSYSEKAIKKLLPLMRLGKYWHWDAVDSKTKIRIEKIITGEVYENIKDRVREKAIHLTEQNHFQGLPEWLAKYVVYDRHSEASDIKKWKSSEDLRSFLKEFKQHSLRNPIVEQVIMETLRVVQDIWQYYGNGMENFFDEIHIELGREMKNTAEDRKRMTNKVIENENTNLRIKLLLAELKENSDGKFPVDDVRSYSPIQREVLRIYEDGVLNSNIEIPEDIAKISKAAQPTKSELIRYKLWLEQKYRSPYTGKPIPLNKLFTSAYEIEHIISQSRYFDDSLSNKVICESAVNQLKDKQLGLEFIKNHYGQKIDIGFGETVEIFSEETYKEFVNEHYDKNRSKRNKLLLEEIPDRMIERQMNDTRYISKYIMSVLSNIVRSDKDDDGLNSKNIIPGNGKITDRLKQDWGLNDVWNELILPRFERMNALTNSRLFTSTNKEGHTIPAMPLELSKGFQKKRIDHRHHAMDALVIACATRDHVNLLNNQSAKSENSRYDLQSKLRNKDKWIDKDGKERYKFTEFIKPWDNFTSDAQYELEKIVVSFKQNLRVINKATNYYERIENGKKIIDEQKGVNWAIRKPLHKETVYGKVDLPRIKVSKGKILTATRKSLNITFDLKTIEAITDTGIQKILKNFLVVKENKPELAFSPEGVEYMNKNIEQFNEGKSHQPIYKVRIFKETGEQFQLGLTGNKKDKYVTTAKGTNLFFAIYQGEGGSRNFEAIPLNIVIERQKQGLPSVPEKNEKDDSLLFHLSPNDLVYVPTEEELGNNSTIDFISLTKEQKKRIYKFTDGSGVMANFIPATIADVLFNLNKEKQGKAGIHFPIQNEIGVGSQGSKNERAITGEQIKSVCIKLKVDRLGNISSLKGKPFKKLKDHLDILSEPETVYKAEKKDIIFFDSLEDMNEATAQAMAQLSGEEHLKNAIEMIKRIYADELSKPMDKKIKFRR
jgi:CRISPR-associated endonuclease Csn1